MDIKKMLEQQDRKTQKSWFRPSVMLMGFAVFFVVPIFLGYDGGAALALVPLSLISSFSGSALLFAERRLASAESRLQQEEEKSFGFDARVRALEAEMVELKKKGDVKG